MMSSSSSSSSSSSDSDNDSSSSSSDESHDDNDNDVAGEEADSYWTSESDVDMDSDHGGGKAMCSRCHRSIYACSCPTELEVPKDFPLLTVLPDVTCWNTVTRTADSVTIKTAIARLVFTTAKDYPALTWGEALKVLQIVAWDDSYLTDILQEGKMEHWLTKKSMWPPLKSSTAPAFVFKSDPVAVADTGVSGAGPSELDCDICEETKPAEAFLQAGCGHFFCKTCWGK